MGEELGIPEAKKKKKEYLTISIASRTHGEEEIEKGVKKVKAKNG